MILSVLPVGQPTSFAKNYELFHDHDRLLFVWGQSEFLCLQKQLPCCAKVAMLPFWLQLVK